MVKIIKGVYGLTKGHIVVPVRAGDPTIELTDEQEARLVRIGVAEYVKADTPVNTENPNKEPQDPLNEETDDTETENALPSYNDDMSLAELKEVAAQYGLKTGSLRTKQAVIDAIEQVKAEMPNLGAEDPVDDDE